MDAGFKFCVKLFFIVLILWVARGHSGSNRYNSGQFVHNYGQTNYTLFWYFGAY